MPRTFCGPQSFTPLLPLRLRLQTNRIPIRRPSVICQPIKLPFKRFESTTSDDSSSGKDDFTRTPHVVREALL